MLMTRQGSGPWPATAGPKNTKTGVPSGDAPSSIGRYLAVGTDVLLLIFDFASRASINTDLFHSMNLLILSLKGSQSQFPIKSSVISQSSLRGSTFQPEQ
jgi:hypothetical protein